MVDRTARSHTDAKSNFHTPSEYMPNCLFDFLLITLIFFQRKKDLCYQWEEMNTFDTVPCMAEAPLVALWALAVQTNKHTRQEKLTLPKTRIPEWCNEGRGQASEGLSPGSSCFYHVVWWLYAGLLPRKSQHADCVNQENVVAVRNNAKVWWPKEEQTLFFWRPTFAKRPKQRHVKLEISVLLPW